MSNLKQPALIILTVALLGFFGLKGYQMYGRYTDAVQSAHDQKVIVQTKIVAHTDTLYDTARTSYTQYRDRVLHDTVEKPTVREKTIIQKADSVVLACDSLKTSTHSLIKTLEESIPQKRLVTYGEALYDVLNKQPVLKLGVDLHLFGPVALTASGEWDVPVVVAQGQLRALVGARVSF